MPSDRPVRYKTLFRLLLKAVGVWLFFSGTATLITGLLQASAWITAGMGPSGLLLMYIGTGAGGAVQTGAGVYLFLGGRWLVDRAIPSNRPYCQECGYELTRHNVTNCPECGTPVADQPGT